MDERKTRVLLVEGSDDAHVVEKLLNRHGMEMSFSILPKGGYPQLRDSIYGEVNAPNRDTVGILADANENLDGRWQSIRGQLGEAGFKAPSKLKKEGIVLDGTGGVRIGVWLMPNNSNPGELEDFMSELIPPDEPIWPRSKSYIEGIP